MKKLTGIVFLSLSLEANLPSLPLFSHQFFIAGFSIMKTIQNEGRKSESGSRHNTFLNNQKRITTYPYGEYYE